MANNHNNKKNTNYKNKNNSKSKSSRNSDTVKQRQIKLEEQDRQRKQLQYAAALSKLILSDINKTKNVTYTQYSKEKYRTYITNPTNNEKNLRDMSNFLYRVSMPYRRFINYLSDIPLFYWNLTPVIDDITGSANNDKILKNYYKILQTLENMSISYEMRKVLTTTIREGVFYGFIYEDKNSFFIHKLDPDYCKIVEVEAGIYNFAFDFSFFDKNATYLEYMDPYFTTLYNQYRNDTTNLKWQILEPQRTICVKVDPDVPSPNLPLLVGLFESLLDLIDIRGLQRNKDEIQNYKLITMKIPAFDSTKEVDDFSIDMDTAVKFYNKLADVVPEAVGVALSPMDINTVDFKNDDDNTSLIANYTHDVFDDSGIAKLLFNSDTTGSVGLEASVKVDSAMVWKLVEYIERWIRRYIIYNSTGSAKYFFDILRVDIFNKDRAIETELSLANSGVPNKMQLAATSGLNPYQTLSSQYFENEILKIHESWRPLQTSYTMSNESTVKEPNDEGDRNADNNGNVDTI